MGKSSSKSATPKSSEKKSKSPESTNTQTSKESSATSPSASTSKSADDPQTSTSTTKSPANVSSQPANLLDDIRKSGTDVPRGNVEPPKNPFDEFLPAVVIDNGSYSCKYGLAGEQSPSGEVRTIVGRHQQDQDDSYVGIDALNKRTVLDLNYPIKRGLITNWDDMETVWDYILHRKIRTDLESRPVVLTEPALSPKENKERMAEIMFESFDMPAFHVLMQPFCALSATGKMNGVVVDIGDGVTDIVPFKVMVPIEESIRRLEFAGRDITEYMMKSPAARGEKITYEVAQTMKTSTCEVVSDFDEVTRLQREGQDVHHLYATEALFTPSILGRNHPGIHSAIIDSIMSCPGERNRANVASNVVLAGGSTLFRGFHDRMERELMELAPPTMNVGVLDRQDRENLVWAGASLFASVSVDIFQKYAITKGEYLEVGPEVVHRKR